MLFIKDCTIYYQNTFDVVVKVLVYFLQILSSNQFKSLAQLVYV